MNQSIPHFQVRHNCLIYYELPCITYGRTYTKFERKAYSGKVTDGARKRINRAVDLLIQKSPKRIIYNSITKKRQPFTINFVTLTVSAIKIISSIDGYKNLLKPFLRKLRVKFKSKISYVWKCELQKRGQIHYHITTNRFIDLNWIKNEWNKLQRKHRYLDHYAKIYKSYNPNSTDIHAVWKVNDVASYLCKYLSKVDPTQKIKSKVWDCSNDLKIKRFSFIPNDKFVIKINSLVKAGKVSMVNLDRCLIFKTKDVKALLERNELLNLKNHLV